MSGLVGGDVRGRSSAFDGSAVIVAGVDGRIVAWDHGAERLYGWSGEEVIGKSLRELLVPEDAVAEAAEIMADLFAGGSPGWRGRFRVRRRDGSTFEAVVHDTPIVVDGRVVAVLGQSTPVEGIWPLDADLAALDPRYGVETIVEARDAWWESFRESARNVASVRALDGLLQDVLATVANSLNADAASLLVADDSDVLVVRAAYGWDAEMVRPVAIPSGAGVSGKVLATGEPLIVADLDEVEVASPQLRRSGFHSYVGVPLKSADRVLGVLHATTFERGRFTPSDARTLSALTGPLTAAVTRVRTLARIADLSNTTTLPAVDGLEVYCRYQAAEGGSGGGDWYDAVRWPDGTAAFAVGDAAGHGLEALISASPVRHALLAYLHQSRSPAEAITLLQRFVADSSFGDHVGFFTALACAWNPRTRIVTSASAGHPPLLHVRGGISTFGPTAGMPIVGAIPGSRPTYTDQSASLEPGDVVVLYTDGLIEGRGISLDEGMTRLAAAAVASAGLPLDELCDELLALSDAERLRDDRSVVVLRAT